MNTVYLSETAGSSLREYLRHLGYDIRLMTKCDVTYDPVSTHPDIFMCRLGVWENPRLFTGDPAKLTAQYPGNIIYNAVCTGKYFIHNLKYTAQELLLAAGEWKGAHSGSAGSFKSSADGSAGSCKSSADGSAGSCKGCGDLSLVDVPQGYTRCCCLPVDDTSFITSDHGIAKALDAAGADVLVIEKGHILLPGFDYGFIGGSAGHVWIPEQSHAGTAGGGVPHSKRRAILFNGDLSAHPDYKAITRFLQDRSIGAVFFKEYPLTDIGSILTTR